MRSTSTSIQARQRYGNHWDDYFKFMIIRNLYERVVSLLSKFNKYYGIRGRDGAIRFGNYKEILDLQSPSNTTSASSTTKSYWVLSH